MNKFWIKTIIVIVMAVIAGPGRAFDIMFEAPGAGSELSTQLRDASLVIEAKNQNIRNGQELLVAARADYARLVGVLYAAGRYGGVITIKVDGREAAEIAPFNAPSQVSRIAIKIQAGPSYVFKRAAIGPLAPNATVDSAFRPGQIAQSTIIRSTLGDAISDWQEHGYAKARLDRQDIVADHDNQTIDTRLAIAPGPRVTFGDLLLTGAARVRPERIRAIAGFPSGEIYAPGKLDKVVTRLRRTGSFASVALDESAALNDDNTLDITAQLSERKPRRIGFGVELSSVDGLTLSGFWLHRNILGGAERFRIGGEIAGLGGETGGVDYHLDLNFDRPATFGPDWDLYSVMQLAYDEEANYQARSARFETGMRRIVSEQLTYQIGLGLRFSEIEDPTGTTRYRHLIFPAALTWDRRDDRLNAQEGFYVHLDALPFVGVDESENGLRLNWDARGYRSIGTKTVMAARVQGGTILGASLAGVPNDDRFFSGGGGSVRGHPFQSLGVTLPSGDLSGGRAYLGASLEARVAASERFGVVAFADWGHVSADSVPGQNGDEHAGAGLGLRYFSAIGPIRLDIARPITGDANDTRFYIGLGQAF